MECLSLWKSAEEASLRAMTTRSHPGGTWASLAASLSLRFILFRSTELPTRRPTENPNRVASERFGRTISTRYLSDQLLP